ncbi:MAG: inositol monophosphatase family protein [Kiloniellales bacterium]
MLPDIEQVTRIIEETSAQEAVPRFRALAMADIKRKASGDLVTAADLAVEHRLEQRLRDLLPGTVAVGEEAVEANQGLIEAVTRAGRVWVIDPIDGTGNFAAGNPLFAVMVSLIEDGITLAGWIHDPIGARSAVASRGDGALMNGRRLQVAPGAHPLAMRGALHASTYAPPELAAQINRRRGKVGAIKSLHCAGQEYLRLAGGETHFAFYSRLLPWDHAAGVLIHREAGGIGRTLAGDDYEARDFRQKGLLLAPDEASWGALYGTLFE